MTLHMWLWICTFLQNLSLSLSVFELCWLKKKKKMMMMNKIPYTYMMLGNMPIVLPYLVIG